MSESSSAHLHWGDWSLDYGVFGTEGLSLVDGYFRGQRVFNKLSLPVIRVKYVVDEHGLSAVWGTGCGPYNDQITWDTEQFGENLNPGGPHHLVKVVCAGGDRYLCSEEVDINGIRFMRLAVYARIGAYHIAQAYYLNDDGVILPRVSSKGLSCDVDHWHHPYWRFDFALGAPEVQRVAVHRTTGAKIADITTELKLVNSSFGEEIEYRITSTQPPDVGVIESPAQAIIRPPLRNSEKGIVGPTAYSNLDGYVRVYRPEEDRDWPHKPEDDISFAVHDPCVDADIVFWSVCHLAHHAHEGKDHWHTVGPDILVRPLLLANVPPEALRRVRVHGKVDVKDFGVLKDRWAHETYDETVLVNPTQRFAEVVKKTHQGDVTAELIVRLEWQPDLSIAVKVTANLFDELERVARVEGAISAARDSAGSANVHLVDHHGGDPDTADITINVENERE
jgi:hypothetical protein